MFARRISAFALYTEKKEILLQHRTDDAPKYPGYWGLFGGGIEEGETPEEALAREAQEELELDLRNIPLFKRYELPQEQGTDERFIYLAQTFKTAGELKKTQHEGQDLGFFLYEQTQKLQIADFNKIILADIAEALERMVT
jgi:8-oxo-dGTP diphosphatase